MRSTASLETSFFSTSSDSSAELRYLVLPERPAGTEGLSEAQLAELVTRDAMIGVALTRPPASAAR